MRPTGSTIQVSGSTPLRLVVTDAFAEDVAKASKSSPRTVANGRKRSETVGNGQSRTGAVNATGRTLWVALGGSSAATEVPPDGVIPHVVGGGGGSGGRGSAGDSTRRRRRPLRRPLRRRRSHLPPRRDSRDGGGRRGTAPARPARKPLSCRLPGTRFAWRSSKAATASAPRSYPRGRRGEPRWWTCPTGARRRRGRRRIESRGGRARWIDRRRCGWR